MDREDKNGEEILKKYGAENIKHYTLISNHGYSFDLKGKHYDCRYWANCYGCALNRWEISCPPDDRIPELQQIEDEFNQ